jgi:hypothetical protein
MGPFIIKGLLGSLMRPAKSAENTVSCMFYWNNKGISLKSFFHIIKTWRPTNEKPDFFFTCFGNQISTIRERWGTSGHGALMDRTFLCQTHY